MKLQADRIEGQNAIARHGPGGVIVNGVEHRRSVLVPWRGDVVEWPVAEFGALTEAHFAALAEMKPELVIFGSGSRIRFVRPALLRPLMERRIGIETMDTAAACRTYNVLLAEGRSVLAALLFETSAAPDGRG
ncbi:MAG: Mth938-like domain-containing protein [Burkholderiales bacterium]|nr:Mth938-like domain-containing protein [Burkholderiales bacterium]